MKQTSGSSHLGRESLIRIATAAVVLALSWGAGAVSPKERPNILLIMADDMGWSDIGCYGGEIDTPNLDRLAEQGMRFTQFYNTAKCFPTRAALLTGLYSHQTGLGNKLRAFNKHYKLYANGFFYDVMNDREEEHSIPADRRSATEQVVAEELAAVIASMPLTNSAYDGKPAKSGRKNKVELPR